MMPRLWVALCLLLSSFACAANDALTSQLSAAFWDGFLSKFIPIVVLGAIISSFLSILSKRPEIALGGCGIVFLLVMVVGLISIVVDFIAAHKVFFIAAGIIIAFIIAIVVIIGVFDSNDTGEPVDAKIPKVYDNSKKQNTSTFTQERLKVHQASYECSSDELRRPATYEDVVGQIPSATELAGKLGEDAVSRAVWHTCVHDNRYFKILRNVYVPKMGGYSEIDVLLLHTTGVYVFESKNVTGNVYGDVEHQQWHRYKGNGVKDFIPNPVLQNEQHIEALCEFLNQNKYQFRAFSVVVFGSRAELKYVPENSLFMSIHEVSSLEIDLMKKLESNQSFYSPEIIDEWNKKLLPFTQLSEEEKQKHKERLSKKFRRIN